MKLSAHAHQHRDGQDEVGAGREQRSLVAWADNAEIIEVLRGLGVKGPD